MFRRILAVIAVSICMMTVACDGDDGGGGGASPTVAATRDPTTIATPAPQVTPSVDIRELDLGALPDVASALTDNGGKIVQADVIYADVTDDGFDDAIAPVSVDGTLGHIGFVALTPDGNSARVLLSEFPETSGGIEIALDGEKILMMQAVPGPDDPECCPGMLRRTIFGWNGNAMAVESVTTEPNPDGGGKKTSTPTQ